MIGQMVYLPMVIEGPQFGRIQIRLHIVEDKLEGDFGQFFGVLEHGLFVLGDPLFKFGEPGFEGWIGGWFATADDAEKAEENRGFHKLEMIRFKADSKITVCNLISSRAFIAWSMLRPSKASWII